MSSSATELHCLTPNLWVWQRYDPAVRAELFSTLLTCREASYLVDPIPLESDSLSRALGGRAVAGVIATNENHGRECSRYARQFSAPLYARSSAGIPDAVPFPDEERLEGGLCVLALEGAAPGECALYDGADGGTLIVGDALINMGSHGFTYLPAKYCSNQKQLRKSLHKLLDLKFERMLFAHGAPIVERARDRLRNLLEQEP